MQDKTISLKVKLNILGDNKICSQQNDYLRQFKRILRQCKIVSRSSYCCFAYDKQDVNISWNLGIVLLVSLVLKLKLTNIRILNFSAINKWAVIFNLLPCTQFKKRSLYTVISAGYLMLKGA